jgi:Tfp pilus assembly protein PilF
VLTLDPGDECAWYNLGLVAQNQNHPTKAIVDYQQALKADRRDTSAMYNEAIALEPSNRQKAHRAQRAQGRKARKALLGSRAHKVRWARKG